MGTQLKSVVFFVGLCLTLGAQDAPRIFVAPVAGEGGLAPSDTAPMTGQFMQIFRDETRYRVVEKESKRVSTGLFGAMTEIGTSDEADMGKADGALKVARVLKADGVVLTTVTRKPLSGYEITVRFLEVPTGAQKVSYKMVSGGAFGDIAGVLTTIARKLNDRLPAPPKARAPFSVRAAKAPAAASGSNARPVQ